MDSVFSLFGLKTTGISGTLTLTKTGTTARTATFPDAAITVAGLEVAQTFTALQTITGTTPGTAATNQVLIGNGFVKSGNFFFVGSTGSGTGGNVRYIIDSGTLKWTTGILGSAGATAFSIYDNVNADSPMTISASSGGAITLARPVTCTGAVTVPNGTAAAPGIRLTGEAHGLYRGGTSQINIAAAGVAVASFTTGSGSYRSHIGLPSVDDTLPVWISAKSEAQLLVLGASLDNGLGTGGQTRLYGGTHATKASYVEFTRGATVSAFFDGSGLLTTNAGRLIKTRSVTSAAGTTTLDGTDHLAVCTGSTTQTFTLPAAAAGRVLFIKNRSTGNLTVNRAGADTIDGTTTVVLTAGQSLQIVANGTDWVIL